MNQKNYFDIVREQCEVVRAFEEIANPVVGYLVKDRLGREILGDNTAFIKQDLPPLSGGQSYLITFSIDAWPNIVEGEYVLAVAVADGTLNVHVQCNYLHDAVIFKSIPIRMPAGIFSILNTDVAFFQVDD